MNNWSQLRSVSGHHYICICYFLTRGTRVCKEMINRIYKWATWFDTLWPSICLDIVLFSVNAQQQQWWISWFAFRIPELPANLNRLYVQLRRYISFTLLTVFKRIPLLTSGFPSQRTSDVGSVPNAIMSLWTASQPKSVLIDTSNSHILVHFFEELCPRFFFFW